MNNRKIAVKFSGGADDQYKDGQMTIKYLNVFSNSEAPSLGFSNWDGGRVDDYSDIFPDYLRKSWTSPLPSIEIETNVAFYFALIYNTLTNICLLYFWQILLEVAIEISF